MKKKKNEQILIGDIVQDKTGRRYTVLSYDAPSNHFRIQNITPNAFGSKSDACYYRSASELKKVDIEKENEKEKKRQKRIDDFNDFLEYVFFDSGIGYILLVCSLVFGLVYLYKNPTYNDFLFQEEVAIDAGSLKIETEYKPDDVASFVGDSDITFTQDEGSTYFMNNVKISEDIDTDTGTLYIYKSASGNRTYISSFYIGEEFSLGGETEE